MITGQDIDLSYSPTLYDTYARCLREPACKSFGTDRLVKLTADLGGAASLAQPGSGCGGVYLREWDSSR